MKRPFADKRPIGPFAQASTNSCNPRIEFLITGTKRGTIAQSINQEAEVQDTVADILVGLQMKTTDIDVNTETPVQTSIFITLARYESHNRVKKLIDEMEDAFEVDGVIIGAI